MKFKENLPNHIGFIMDGNGRWAKKRSLPRTFGHKAGAESFKKIAKYCKSLGIKYITFYAFSTENWKRPKEEVDVIMELFWSYLSDAENFAKDKTRLIFLGDKSAFGEKMAKRMTELEEASADFDEMTLLLAMNYGGRDDILHSVKKIVELYDSGFVQKSDINEELISNLLYTKDVPDVDLVIRPSGEFRISNFLIWQSAYAEFYFTDCLWPDFNKKELDKALEDFSKRNRRFGGV